MKLFKTVFLVGLATISLGSAAMGDPPATGADSSVPCTADNQNQGAKPVNAGPGGSTITAPPSANGASNNTDNTPPPVH
jgi:hypothetical protein